MIPPQRVGGGFTGRSGEASAAAIKKEGGRGCGVFFSGLVGQRCRRAEAPAAQQMLLPRVARHSRQAVGAVGAAGAGGEHSSGAALPGGGVTARWRRSLEPRSVQPLAAASPGPHAALTGACWGSSGCWRTFLPPCPAAEEQADAGASSASAFPVAGKRCVRMQAWVQEPAHAIQGRHEESHLALELDVVLQAEGRQGVV